MNKRDLFRLINSTFDDLFGSYSYNLNLPKGETKSESGNDELGEWTKTTFNSDDGNLSYTSFVRYGNSDLPLNTKKDKLSMLKEELEFRVQNQEFEKAVELRDRIKLIEKNKESINDLKKQLMVCVSNQDFENAAILRDKIKDLEKQLWQY